MPQSVSLVGFAEFEKKIKSLPKVLQQDVSEEVKESARHWESLAKNAAPVDQGRLRSEIRGFLIEPLTANVVVNVEYAPFIEWGTKTRVRVPSNIAQYAAQFRGAKLGSGNAKKFIYAWMNRVGIPKDRQWPVFYSIITKGVKPHPFFFIQLPIIQKEFIQNLKNVLNSID